jgi:thiamine biosynthesis lipoprotein
MPLAERTLVVPAMGGSLLLHVAYQVPPGDPGAMASAVTRDLEGVARRVERWAARLTRFSEASDLSALNADPARPAVAVGGTLAAVLDWAERATDLAPGLIDVTLLDERLAAETGATMAGVAQVARDQGRRWHLVRRARGGLVVRHDPCRFDLDGVAKGWIADRALGLLGGYPAALVDADGDIAVRVGQGISWDIAVADPRQPDGEDLASLRVDDTGSLDPVGIATSGTSVHRWGAGTGAPPRHHLLDPRTRRPAVTDVVQATVIADSARTAEVLAKAIVIAGSDAAVRLLEDARAEGAILLLESGDVVSLPLTAGSLA